MLEWTNRHHVANVVMKECIIHKSIVITIKKILLTNCVKTFIISIK